MNFDIKKYQVFLLPTFIFLGVILSGFFILKPKINQILSFRRDFDAQKTKLAQLTLKSNYLGGLDQVELGEKTNLVIRALPAEKDFVSGLGAIKSLASSSGLLLAGIQVEPGDIIDEASRSGKKKYNLSFLEFDISLTGTLSQFKDFIKKISTTLPLMELNSIDIVLADDQTAEIECRLDLFFSPLPSTLGPIEKPIVAVISQEEATYRELTKMTPFQSEPFTPLPSGKDNPFIL